MLVSIALLDLAFEGVEDAKHFLAFSPASGRVLFHVGENVICNGVKGLLVNLHMFVRSDHIFTFVSVRSALRCEVFVIVRMCVVVVAVMGGWVGVGRGGG